MSRFPPPARIPRVRKRIAARPAVFPGPVGRAGIATLPGARTGDCPASFRLLNSAADRSVSGPARSRSSTSQHAGGNLRVFTRGYALLLLLTLIALFLAAPRPLTPAPLAGGAVILALLLAIGLRAAARFERGAPLLEGLGSSTGPSTPSPLRRLGIALMIGVLLGGVLLGALMLLASVEPQLKARLAARVDQPFWMPLALAVEASILEEIVFRLFLLSVVVWLAVRLFLRKGKKKKKQEE